MLYRTGSSRPGISLLEVLTAIFIMGIGMLALLTLFPLGALSMARAVRDDRAASIAANAAAMATVFDLRNDAALNTAFTAWQPTNAMGPSNLVMVDPFVVIQTPTTFRPLGEYPAGGGGTSHGIERATPAFVANLLQANRWFTLQDEIEFESLGSAKGSPTSVNRPATYSYAYLVRRPRRDSREVTEVTVIVYANRGTETFNAEPTYNAAAAMGTTGANSLTYDWTMIGAKPDIRKGNWIVDTSAAAGNVVNGFVYKVENVTESAGNLITLELDRPLKANVTTFVVLTHAIAVVERGTSWLP
jgi:hypothetical protein